MECRCGIRYGSPLAARCLLLCRCPLGAGAYAARKRPFSFAHQPKTRTHMAPKGAASIPQVGIPMNPMGGLPTPQTLLQPAPSDGFSQIGNVGAVSDYPTTLVMGQQLDSFNVTMTNASAVAKTYIIGDPNDLIADEVSGTLNDPTSASVNVQAMKRTFANAPVAVLGWNYQVQQSAQQFGQNCYFYGADINGQLFRKPVPVSQGKRNNQFDPLLLTLQFQMPFVFTWNTAIVITVMAGESVYFEFFPWAAGNRT